MTFEELLLNYWTSHASLYDVVHFSNVFAGSEAEAEMPFVKILVNERKTACPTSGARSPGALAVHLELHHDSYDAATEMLGQLIDGLNGVRIPTEADGTFILRFTARHHKRLGETHWVLTAVFRCLTG